MSRRRRGLLVALLAAVLLLFTGRWAASFLADGWWAAQFSPSARTFLSGIRLLRLAIDAAAVALAAGWFIGHLVIVVRAVGSVQIPRHVANLEFREAVRGDYLLAGAAGTGLVLGLLVGLDASARWPTFVLAWHGVRTGMVEPLLGRDTGLYLAQLPLWRVLHEFAFVLVAVATALMVTLYGVIGAIRVERRRLAINDHARSHLGLLLAALALVLAWGYALEPFELVASFDGAPTLGAFRRVAVVAPALTGVALMVAALSALWTFRPKHALLAAAWVILVVASLAGHHVAPLVARGELVPAAPDSVARRMEAFAFGLEGIRQDAAPALIPAPLFDAEAARRIFAAQEDVATIDAGSIVSGARQQPAWLVLTGTRDAPARLVAVAADRAGSAGGPLFYRPGDSLAYPNPYATVTLGQGSVRPGAPRYFVGDIAHGVPVGSVPRRLALAWALQAGELLGPVPGSIRIDWALSPGQRLASLAPFATWSGVRARVVNGTALWVADGYVTEAGYPLVAPAAWRGGRAGFVRAGFLGVVDATSGAARVVLRDDNDPVAAAWAEISEGVVEPASALSPMIAQAAGYPPELFALQADVLGARPDAPGSPAVPRPGARLVQAGWDSSGTDVLLAPFHSADGGRVTALFSATGAATPVVSLVDNGLLAARALERRWARFATFAPIQDSVVGAGAELRVSDVHFWMTPEGLGALQVHAAARPGARPSVVWVTVATGRRLGAGRTFREAWENLQGTTVPAPPGATPGALSEARHWMRLADEALRRSDWAAFGRAFDALRGVLQPEGE
ncbi:MAG TPA: UPF0182 family protein [Gemmatimonadales bacterium]